MDFQNFQKSNFDRGKFLKILLFINLPWDHMMSHKKFGPDRFSRFDVYWIQTDKQTNRQTNKQTDKPNLYIDCDLLPKAAQIGIYFTDSSTDRISSFIFT